MPTFDAALDTLASRFERLREERRLPGLAWGLVREGELARWGGGGTARTGEEATPGPDTVFRIASMTKSFTAAAVLLLRDEGRLTLDDPVAQHVPELAAWPAWSDDSRPITLRQLLTMAAGLPTDDPWGDRQQSLPLDAFADLLAAGPTLAWAPGTQFDYSNLGYGILGRVISNVSSVEHRDVVRDRLLVPLGMTSTVYTEEEVPPDRLAHGYKLWDETLEREDAGGYGALASMGGIFSTVRDLATWISGFLDAFPARSGEGMAHPVARASRREMQQVHRAFGADVREHRAEDDPVVTALGYGLGLFVFWSPGVGTIVSHSGGYPGYGSNMAWHPASGTGLVALANHRYAAVSLAAGPALRELVAAEGAPRRPLRRMAAVDEAQAVAERLLAGWDDALADAAFAMNMDLDTPRGRRRSGVEAAAASVGGPFGADLARPPVDDSPASRTWWLRGERGWVRLRVLVTPETSPRIQTLVVTAVCDPSAALARAGGRLLALAATSPVRWPDDFTAADGLDRAALLRNLRAAEARFGVMALGLPVDGDGTAGATWQLDAERGTARLRVTLDAAGALADAAVVIPAPDTALETW